MMFNSVLRPSFFSFHTVKLDFETKHRWAEDCLIAIINICSRTYRAALFKRIR